MKSLALIISFVIFVTQTCKSQGSLPPGTYTSANKKAIALFEEGKKNWEQRNYEKSEAKLLDALTKDPNFVEAHTALGFLYIEKNQMAKAKNLLRKRFLLI